MIRGKIYHKKNRRIYRLLNIDYFNNKVDVIDENIHATFDFKDVKFLETTYLKAKNSFIYRNDYIIAKKDFIKYKGVVKRAEDGCFYLECKTLDLKVGIKGLIEQNFKIINLGNYGIYFEKMKAKKAEK